MKDYYALLEVGAGASADDIKRAFRREIARYHPDKVHHLGAEFQALAAERAAELTEAYRVLMDDGLRATYDRERESGGVESSSTPPAAAQPRQQDTPREAETPREPAAKAPSEQPPAAQAGARTAPPAPPPRSSGGASRDAFVTRMSMSRFRDAIARAVEGATSMPVRGFDASYLVKGKRSLFGKSQPERLLTAYIGSVSPEAVTKLGQLALAGSAGGGLVTVFALGDTLAPAADLSAAIIAVRKRAPAGVTLQIVPVDVRDWSAMMPKDASAGVRAVIAQLTAAD